jgi:hypothetical protein
MGLPKRSRKNEREREREREREKGMRKELVTQKE